MIAPQSALYLIAHPDDEDALTVTGLARGGARVGLFSLTRGEGGDNRVGIERGELLGARRTAELQQACAHYGVSWLGFSRAYDYGYSRHLSEADALWDLDQLGDDLISAIELFRPEVLISRFAGVPGDGHAHHQLCGRLAAEVARRLDMTLWVGEPDDGGGDLLIAAPDSELRSTARAGYLCHRSQDPAELWEEFCAEPVRYRRLHRASEARARVDEQVGRLQVFFDSRDTGQLPPVLADGIRSAP